MAAAVQRAEVQGAPCERELLPTVDASVAALFERWDKKRDELVLKRDKLTLDADDNAPVSDTPKSRVQQRDINRVTKLLREQERKEARTNTRYDELMEKELIAKVIAYKTRKRDKRRRRGRGNDSIVHR